MTPKEGLEFVRRHGVVLQAARGPVPSLAEAIAGGPIRGSWWGHPKGQEIFAVAEAICENDEVLVCKLVDGKITYVTPTIVASVREARRSVSEEGFGEGVERAYGDWRPPFSHDRVSRMGSSRGSGRGGTPAVERCGASLVTLDATWPRDVAEWLTSKTLSDGHDNHAVDVRPRGA